MLLVFVITRLLFFDKPLCGLADIPIGVENRCHVSYPICNDFQPEKSGDNLRDADGPQVVRVNLESIV